MPGQEGDLDDGLTAGQKAQAAADNKNFQEQFDAACWKIVDEMQDKFIDLCVDDNHSAYGNEMPQKQDQFRAHLEKLNFEFKT